MPEPAPIEAIPPTDTAATPALPLSTFGARSAHARTVRRMLTAFTYRDFRMQWFGACTSSIGTWMQIVAQNWLVLSLTNSPFFLGLDAFVQQLPIILFTLIGGVLADRHDRRRTLLTSQCIQMATAFTLAAYSRLMAFSGAGSVAGALIVAWLGKFRRMGLTALVVQAVYGGLILAFAASRLMWVSKMLLFLTGAALMVVFSTVTSLIQLIVPNEMRGRVMGIYLVAFRGGMPLGSLVSGYLATFLGAPMVIGINGVLLMMVAAYFLARSHGVREA